MNLRYLYNGQSVAEGERTFVYQGGKLFVRTGVLSSDTDQIVYRLREVFDTDQAPTNQPPTLTGGDIHFTVPGGQQ